LRVNSALIGIGPAPDEQRLGLGQSVRQEQRLLIGDRVRGADRHDELDGRFARTLMQPLEECMLGVGADVAPQRGRRGLDANAAVARNALAMAFQDQLLQIGGQAEQRLRIRNDDALDMPQMRAVPPAREPEEHREVPLERCLPEMRIDAPGARQQLLVALPPDLERDRQPGRRPDGVRPLTHSHIGRMSADATPNALAAAALPVTAMKCELTSTPLPSAASSHDLAPGGIRQRLLGGEGFRSDDEQRGRRIVRRQRAREVLRIDVGDERDVDPLRLRAGAATRARRARERRADEKRSEIGPADAELTTARMGRPAAPTRRPPRICAASVRIRDCAARMSGMMSRPATRSGESSAAAVPCAAPACAPTG
jgi:hypothetical protein